MKIVLIRHGKPDIPKPGKIRAREVHQWIKSYNAAGLKLDHKPSKEAIEIASNCKVVVCSDLPRSMESARALGVRGIDFTDSMFREARLPYSCFPSPKLSPRIWEVLSRVFWFFGYSSNGESFREAKRRASNGANRLKEIAENTGSVILVGHGFVNRFIAKELLLNGWQGPVSPGKKYWEFGVYKYTT